MPVPSEVQNGLSTSANVLATPVNGTYFSSADLNPYSSNPSEIIPSVRQDETVVQARVPLDIPPYYTLFKINHYSRASWLEVGKLEIESGVIFPFPTMMIDNQNMSYEIQPLGFAAGMGFDALAKGYDAVRGISSVQDALNKLAGSAFNGPTPNQYAGAAGGAALDIATRIGAGALGRYGDAALAVAGISVNDFMTVMFRGPNYSRRDFQWKFSPNSHQEANELRTAILILKTAAAASLAGFIGSAFFGWPRIFQVEFRHIDPNIDMGFNTFRMKPAVLTDVSVNYTPAGVWGPTHTKMPESVEVRLSFLELEYWLNSSRRSRDAFTRTGSINEGGATDPQVGNPAQENPTPSDGFNPGSQTP